MVFCWSHRVQLNNFIVIHIKISIYQIVVGETSIPWTFGFNSYLLSAPFRVIKYQLNLYLRVYTCLSNKIRTFVVALNSIVSILCTKMVIIHRKARKRFRNFSNLAIQLMTRVSLLSQAGKPQSKRSAKFLTLQIPWRQLNQVWSVVKYNSPQHSRPRIDSLSWGTNLKQVPPVTHRMLQLPIQKRQTELRNHRLSLFNRWTISAKWSTKFHPMWTKTHYSLQNR